MRFFVAVSVFVAMSFPAFAYEVKATVIAAQEALARLGYEVGAADGAWGAKSREAMNALRQANGLPPAEDFTGSSLALVHRLSPGDTTLPNPGFFFTDVPARRAFLTDEANSKLAFQQCPPRVGRGATLQLSKPVVAQKTKSGKLGYITGDEDWYSPIMEGLVGATDACLTGNDRHCAAIIDFARRWAEADSLTPTASRKQDAFEDISWVGNIMLRNTMLAYAVARQLADVPAKDEAVILDWLKRRIDDYHYITAGQRDNLGNHGVAHMMPAMIFGILVGDRTMVQPALDIWQDALKTMRKDGSLPGETRRGARWAHYSFLQLGQLISIAEMAAGQGIDVYAMSPSETKTVQQVINWLVDAMADFDVARPYSKANFASPGKDYTVPYLKEFFFGWVPAYASRFGNDTVMQRINTAVIDPRICSDASFDEEKIAPAACTGTSGDPVPLFNVLKAIGSQPLMHMGYPAGCLQATEAWPPN